MIELDGPSETPTEQNKKSLFQTIGKPILWIMGIVIVCYLGYTPQNFVNTNIIQFTKKKKEIFSQKLTEIRAELELLDLQAININQIDITEPEQENHLDLHESSERRIQKYIGYNQIMDTLRSRASDTKYKKITEAELYDAWDQVLSLDRCEKNPACELFSHVIDDLALARDISEKEEIQQKLETMIESNSIFLEKHQKQKNKLPYHQVYGDPWNDGADDEM